MSFIEWFNTNIFSNCFTLITVILSGIISLIISAVFYHKGNRNNLKISVIHPIIRLLDEAYSKNNYDRLSEIAKDYSTRYLKDIESERLNSLLLAYKEVCTYNDVTVNVDILFSYFEYKLKKNGINPMPVLIEYEDEIIYSDFPPDIFYLRQDLENFFIRYYPILESNECENMVASIYKRYCKEIYTSNSINYFDDYTLEEVLEKSEIRAKWNKKFDKLKTAKEQFLKLKIAK